MDSRRMVQVFQEIEEIAGPKIGSYLRNEGMNLSTLMGYLEDDFTVKQIENLKNLLDEFSETHRDEFQEMDGGFKSQLKQITSIRKCIFDLADTMDYQISNLPNLLELVVQQQLQNVLRCYRTHHTHDLVNMEKSLKDLQSQGFQATDDKKLKFLEIYLKNYFSKVVAQSIQTGAYKKYKVSVINRFQERYEEMLAG